MQGIIGSIRSAQSVVSKLRLTALFIIVFTQLLCPASQLQTSLGRLIIVDGW